MDERASSTEEIRGQSRLTHGARLAYSWAVNVYGRSKLMAEELVMAAATRHFVIRVLLLLGTRGNRGKNALYKMIMGLRSGQVVRASVD